MDRWVILIKLNLYVFNKTWVHDQENATVTDQPMVPRGIEIITQTNIDTHIKVY